MMASAECCFSVTIDGRTERVPFLGDGDAGSAPLSTNVGDSADPRTQQTHGLAGFNPLANRPIDAWFGHCLFLHRPNIRVDRRRLYRRRHEWNNRPI